MAMLNQIHTFLLVDFALTLTKKLNGNVDCSDLADVIICKVNKHILPFMDNICLLKIYIFSTGLSVTSVSSLSQCVLFLMYQCRNEYKYTKLNILYSITVIKCNTLIHELFSSIDMHDV